MVFLKYVDGDMVKYTQPKVDQNLVSTISCCNDETSQVTPVTFGHFSIASQDMIRYLPTLSKIQYQNFLTNKSLVQTIRLLSRILSMTLPLELLEKLKCQNYRQYSVLEVKKNPQAITEFLPKECTSLLMKLAFLVLVKTKTRVLKHQLEDSG